VYPDGLRTINHDPVWRIRNVAVMQFIRVSLLPGHAENHLRLLTVEDHPRLEGRQDLTLRLADDSFLLQGFVKDTVNLIKIA
jgi:hypothetical protein